MPDHGGINVASLHSAVAMLLRVFWKESLDILQHSILLLREHNDSRHGSSTPQQHYPSPQQCRKVFDSASKYSLLSAIHLSRCSCLRLASSEFLGVPCVGTTSSPIVGEVQILHGISPRLRGMITSLLIQVFQMQKHTSKPKGTSRQSDDDAQCREELLSAALRVSQGTFVNEVVDCGSVFLALLPGLTTNRSDISLSQDENLALCCHEWSRGVLPQLVVSVAMEHYASLHEERSAKRRVLLLWRRRRRRLPPQPSGAPPECTMLSMLPSDQPLTREPSMLTPLSGPVIEMDEKGDEPARAVPVPYPSPPVQVVRKGAEHDTLRMAFDGWKRVVLDPYHRQRLLARSKFVGASIEAMRRRRVKHRMEQAANRKLLRTSLELWRDVFVKYSRDKRCADAFRCDCLRTNSFLRWSARWRSRDTALRCAELDEKLSVYMEWKAVDTIKRSLSHWREMRSVAAFRRHRVVRVLFSRWRTLTQFSRRFGWIQLPAPLSASVPLDLAVPRVGLVPAATIWATKLRSTAWQRWTRRSSENRAGRVYVRSLFRRWRASAARAGFLALAEKHCEQMRLQNLRRRCIVHWHQRCLVFVPISKELNFIAKKFQCTRLLSLWRKKAQASRALRQLLHAWHTLREGIIQERTFRLWKQKGSSAVGMRLAMQWQRVHLLHRCVSRWKFLEWRSRCVAASEAELACDHYLLTLKCRCLSQWRGRLRQLLQHERELCEAEQFRLAQRYHAETILKKCFLRWTMRRWENSAIGRRFVDTSAPTHSQLETCDDVVVRCKSDTLERRNDFHQLASARLGVNQQVQTVKVPLRRQLLSSAVARMQRNDHFSLSSSEGCVSNYVAEGNVSISCDLGMAPPPPLDGDTSETYYPTHTSPDAIAAVMDDTSYSYDDESCSVEIEVEL